MSYDTGIGIDCREFRLGRGKAAEPWATLAPKVLARIFFLQQKGLVLYFQLIVRIRIIQSATTFCSSLYSFIMDA
jgi:hypothetical protein